MEAVGVVAEYNPFHRGHAWQLEHLRELLPGVAVICAMSGNFVQRGEAAIVEKHLRAEAAVRGGADLVLELPLPWAISSAEGFARGGVEVLDATGVVGTLAFGSECADTEALCRVADCLGSEAYRAALRELLPGGATFAACREAAVRSLLGAEDAALLEGPNNNLGVEYCKAIAALGSGMRPLALPRTGVGHDGKSAGGIASASHIRALLQSLGSAEAFLTADMARLYAVETAAARAPVQTQTLERAMLARFRCMEEADFAAFDPGEEGLYRRFFAASREATSLAELLDAVKTKRYAHARLRRMALAAFLNVPAALPETVPYLHVLAMNGRGRALLHEMKHTARLPVITKSAAARTLPETARRVFETEARGTDLYTLAWPVPGRGGMEWRTGPVLVEEEKDEKNNA